VLTLRVHSYDPLGVLGDPMSYDAARAGLKSYVALAAGVPSSAVLLTSVATSRTLVEPSDWNAPLAGPQPAAWPPRRSVCSVQQLTTSACAELWYSVTLADVTLSITGLPTYACVADSVAALTSGVLNTPATLAALAGAVIHGALPGGGLGVGYSVPSNVRVSMGPTSVQAPAIAACAGAAGSLTLSQLTGFDVRALPASYSGNTAGAGIVVINAAACAAVAGTNMACKAQTFSISGTSYSARALRALRRRALRRRARPPPHLTPPPISVQSM
jgi:hypothetical protein